MAKLKLERRVIPRNDSYPPIRFLAKDSGGTAVNLSTGVTSMRFLMKSSAGTLSLTPTAIWPVDAQGYNGKVSLTPAQAGTANSFDAELEVIWTTAGTHPGGTQTFPNGGPLGMYIREDVA